MTYTARASELANRPVVTLDTATEAARLADVVIDPANGNVIGFTLQRQGLLGMSDRGALPITAVRAVGRDAVMISAETGIVPSGAMPAGLGAARDIHGDQVVTQEGAVQGRVTDVILRIDRDSVDVIGYEIEGGNGSTALVAVPDTFAISADALIVSKEMQVMPATDLEAFSGTVDQLRRKGSR